MCCGSFPKCEYSPLEGLINYKMLNRQKKKSNATPAKWISQNLAAQKLLIDCLL